MDPDHVIAVATIRDPVWAVGYLLLFGAGTIAGMMLVTAAIGLPFAYTAGRFVTMHRALGVASGLLSLGFGLFLAYQTGLVDGLFHGGGQGQQIGLQVFQISLQMFGHNSFSV